VALVVAIAVPASLRSSGGTGAPEPGPAGGSTTAAPCQGTSCQDAATAAAIRTPLHLPTVAPGGTCPVSGTKEFAGGAGFSGRFTALGTSPLYLTGVTGSGVLTLGTDTVQAHGRTWRDQKVIWVVDRSYAGPLLLRGGRIDGTGDLGFDRYIGASGYVGGSGDGRPHAQLLYVRSGLGAQPDHTLSSYPSGLYAQQPGCYAVQVDGEGFSRTLVFRIAG